MIRILHPSGSYVHSIHSRTKSLTKTPEAFVHKAMDFKTAEHAQKWLDKNLAKCKDLKGCTVVVFEVPTEEVAA
jgi:hypothetical protein